ncbi:MAG TPA: toll/interleukin-1 receptor domain-containing protein [Pyrinomonadaceae bacterium]|nr:toll/interleukin-1 receptor domain-containing protein [Pyrinomonadaceae bacterium]
MFPNEVFLSHSSLDEPFVSTLADVMRRHGIPVWYSQTNIIGAQQWHDEIGAALKRCDWFVLILSPNSVKSLWVKREILFALNDNRYADKIVPLLYQPCDFDQLSWTLSIFQMVDFVADFESGCRSLLRVWGLGYKKS